MLASTLRILGTRARHHSSNVMICPPTELARKIPGYITIESLMATAIWISCARTRKQRPQIRIFLTAVHTIKRSFFVTFKQSVLAASIRML